jgi:drug/metabolite transporter (DMT)-like permease
LALKKIPACIASVAISASYEIVAVLAHLPGKEPLRWPQIAGLPPIGSGVLLVHQN